MALQIKVMHDYQCDPLWVKRADIFMPESPDRHGLSASLVGRLEAWRLWGESRTNLADPHDSRVISEEEAAGFDAEGRLLAARIGTELPGATVSYWLD